MTLCRSLLDGIEDDGDADLQGRVTEGRCTGQYVLHPLCSHLTPALIFSFYFDFTFSAVALVRTVCMGSTYEDDCEEGDEIILCDGCNAEAHMK